MFGPAVLVDGLSKSFGEKRVLDGVSFAVREGTIFGLLGPNGAGKTTVVRILCTLLKADGGRVELLGHDVAREPQRVRALIGLTGQYAAVDDVLSARENLYMIGRLLGLPSRRAKQRAGDLLAVFGLAADAGKTVKSFSGGMRRRLDLAASLVGEPRVLFLDEPTTGLDVVSRGQLWDLVEALAAEGTTIVLTTQYLEEADRLASQIAVIDHGHVVAAGTPEHLKERTGGQIIEVRPVNAQQVPAVRDILARITGQPVTVERDTVSSPAADPELLGHAINGLTAARIPVSQAALRLPSLDEAFLQITERAAR